MRNIHKAFRTSDFQRKDYKKLAKYYDSQSRVISTDVHRLAAAVLVLLDEVEALGHMVHELDEECRAKFWEDEL